MSGYETRTDQFGLVSGIRQSTSDLITIAEPGTLFAPEARKGRLYLVTEADQDPSKGRDACQLIARTVRKTFYDDSSFSVTAALRAAIRAANKALYQHNFNVADHRRAYVGLTCAVVKGRDLFIAQVAPAQAYVWTEGKLRALPTHPSWNPAHLSAMPFFQTGALGHSLFVEPEFYRCPMIAGDAVILCSSNVAPLLDRAEVDSLLRCQDPAAAIERLHLLCRQYGLSEAHALMIELLPGLSPAARTAPLSAGGLRERGRLVLRTIGDWFAEQTGEAVLVVRSKKSSKRAGVDAQGAARSGAADPPDPLTTLPEQPDYPVHPLPKPQPIELGESLDQRYERERPAQSESSSLPPSTFLGESPAPQRRIDLSDVPSLSASARPYRPRRETRPLVDLTWSERLVLPFERIGMAASDMAGRMRRRRVRPPSAPIVRNQGLSYRRQKPPFPWILLLVLGLSVSLLILYGVNLSRRSAQQEVQNYLAQAEQRMAAVREVTDESEALERLDNAQQAIEEIRANPLVTETNATIWLRYQELRREYERAQAAVQRLTYFENPTILAEHPLPDGRFTSIIVPPSTSNLTDTHALEALRYIYALDSDRNTARLYRIPRDGGAPEPYLSAEEAVQNTIVGSVRAQSWRVDNVVVLDQGVNGFGYYFRNAGVWNYTRLGGSEIWSPRGRLDLETYEGNLYVWGAAAGEIFKYESGRYGDPPVLWLDPAGLGGNDPSTAVDMAVDGNIYLLQPDGRALVLNVGRVEREILPESIVPPITAVTRFFITGPPDGGWIFLVDTLRERIIQVEKSSGKVIQQMRVHPDEPLQLDQLTDLYVDSSGSQPILYLVNGAQIMRVEMPAPPRPFRQSDSEPTSEPAPEP